MTTRVFGRTGAGPEKICTLVAALIDTNLLVYRFDSRFPEKQRIATHILRRGIVENNILVPHQAVIGFVATTRSIRGQAVLTRIDALREAEELLGQFTILYPNEAIFRNAMPGCVAYQMNWFDAQMWSYAEYFGLREILTEDLQHDRVYGTVRVVNPFINVKARV